MKPRKLKGVAAVEFAFILIPMLILCLGITEVGRALFQYEGVVRATRGAARYLTQKDLNDPLSTEYKKAVNIAVSMALCGKAKEECSDTDGWLVTGLKDKSQVDIKTYPNVPTGQGTVSLVTVTVGGTGSSAVKFIPTISLDTEFLGVKLYIGPYSFEPVTLTMAYSTT